MEGDETWWSREERVKRSQDKQRATGQARERKLTESSSVD